MPATDSIAADCHRPGGACLPFPLTVLRPVRVAAADFWPVVPEQAFARNVIDLQPDAIRVLEQHRIIARRKFVLLRRVNDARADLFQELVRRVDVGALARPETMVMQADRALPESLPGISGAGA